MKKVLVVLLIIIGTLAVNGQEWLWSEDIECSGNVIPMDVITDNSGNIYVTGTFQTSTLTIGSLSVTNAGGKDCFIAKFNSDGEIQWLRGIGGSAEDETTSLQIIGNSLYVSGNYRNNAVFFTPVFSLPNQDNFDSFFAWYDLNGNFINAVRIFTGQGVERIKDMFYNSTVGNLCFVLQFKTEIIYTDGSGSVTVTARSDKDMMIVKSSLLGVVQDTAIYATSIQNSVLKDINRSNDNGYYLTGDLLGTMYFDDTHSITGNSDATADLLIVKVDQNLNFQWARKGGGIGFDHANNGISDIYGNVYITGKVEADVVFDSTATLSSAVISGFGAQDLYLAKYNKLGTLQWVRRKGDAGNDDGFGLIQRENLLQFCGNISGEVIFNEDTLTTSGIADVNTGFAIFDTKGNEIGAQGIGGTGEDIGTAITFDINGNTIISGYSQSNPLVIGDSSYTNTTGTYNGFVANYFYPMKAVYTTIKEVECNGASTGRLIITPFFGVGPYTYNWSPNVTSSNDSLAFNLSADTYSVTVTDSRFITAQNTIVLTEPPPININSSLTQVSCHPSNGISNNGTIDLTVSGGTVSGPYIYSWEALSGSGVAASSEDQTTLTMGQYSVTVSDDNLCEAYDTFLIAQPDQITFGLSDAQPEIDPPGNNGSVDLEVAGGTANYTYDWTGPGGFVSTLEDISGLAGGSYTVVVEDANNCMADTSFLVSNDSLLIAYIANKTNVDCRGNSTGSATVSVSGGVGPYIYSWENSGGNPIPGNQSITNVPFGTYYVTITDQSDGDMAETSVQIQQPAQDLSASVAGTDLECFGDNSGIADLTVSGGTLPYAFHWNNNATSEDLVDLPAGDYFVTVTDNNGCIATDGVEITQPPALDINITINQPIFCNGDLTGILTATATGGTGTKFYIWDDPANQTTQTADGLEAGTYGVTATDIVGCSVNDQINLPEPSLLSLTETHQYVSCFGGSDGLINLSVSGGTPQYNYEWSGGQIIQDISGIEADTFTVTVTDANNCTASLSVEITQPGAVIFQNVELTGPTCYGYNDGSINITAQGGSGNYQYSFDGGTTYSADSENSDITAGNYTLRIRDDNGCESADSVISLNQPEGTTLLGTEATDVICFGLSDGTLTISANSSVGGLTYSIDEGINYIDNGGEFTNLPAGFYIISIRDGNNCDQEFPEIEIGEPEPVDIDTNITQVVGDRLGEIEVVASGGIEPYNYHLIVQSVDSSYTTGTFPGLIPGDYSVYILDDNSCSSDTLVVDMIQISTELIIYDAFSPNDDGLNEVWNIRNISMYPDCVVTIYNAWGNKVFTSNGYSEPWNGTYNGKDLPAGTYYYIIDLGDGSDPLSGPVSIVR